MVERAVRRVKQGTAAALVQSGLSEELLGQAMECCGQLRNVYDKLAESKIAYANRYGLPFDGPNIPFAAKILFKPRTRKDEARFHQICTKLLPGTFIDNVLNTGQDGQEIHSLLNQKTLKITNHYVMFTKIDARTNK